ncbi:hypothetical protein J1G42_03050 [Cellulomonas sp. zg-ZUI222]|uniref:Uncharacterized protein n=1 Tax=Cellulomonas wangleii TaxID=2816956 RepID=A0ABX8D3W1_9CELL|nr:MULTISPECIES: hypothetical protein [Cellulomonas]MBO0898952.1 hypothetical protein [Cellulomonas sp. zg-ZUI22]MBO0919803.1 hypothetical protein [Cellulomonas wangleii]MBO0923761.1 hypothetical protein [Cellulomonas wangleii]MBO0924043.1 hypothetical protein [Cellulomonas wangleii]QVI62069.1 hypothetical protein KG103_16910 [Cellulomonas wangleii]
MTAHTEYFGILWDGDSASRPRAILRRRPVGDEWEEELLRSDGTWEGTGILALVSLNMYEHDVQPISAATARDFERRLLSRRPAEHDES